MATARKAIRELDTENGYDTNENGDEKYSKHNQSLQQRNKKLFLLCISFFVVLIFLSYSSNNSAANQSASVKNDSKRQTLQDHQQQHQQHQPQQQQPPPPPQPQKLQENYQEQYESQLQHQPKRYRFSDRRMLPPLPGENEDISLMMETLENAIKSRRRNKPEGFRRSYGDKRMDWENDAELYDSDQGPNKRKAPFVDYTALEYTYVDLLHEPPAEGGYPVLKPLGEIMDYWPQDDLDYPPPKFKEQLLHFDYMDPEQREAALRFRDRELPFKVYNVPELHEANKKWTDDYLSEHFDGIHDMHGQCQESKDNFFSFFRNTNWNIATMGDPPTMDTDFTYAKWAKHARYADKVGLEPHEKHYYWQAGVPKQERRRNPSTWSFCSKDLPSFSSPDPTFFGFNPPEQKGIQCRFGERGVTAATHYDAGRNMVAMITGAKRYILSPPKACPKLGIIAEHKHPAFRHSLLNFGHLNLIKDGSSAANQMSNEERSWLNLSNDSLAVDTVLKAGEVLYIPSHWFHYIISLQKSAQCNTRSGRHIEGSKEFGGYQTVMNCVGKGA